MAGRGFTCFSDAILQIDCISCIRCILNTNIGLEYFISNDVYTKKLTMGKSGFSFCEWVYVCVFGGGGGGGSTDSKIKGMGWYLMEFL